MIYLEMVFMTSNCDGINHTISPMNNIKDKKRKENWFFNVNCQIAYEYKNKKKEDFSNGFHLLHVFIII